MKKTGLVLLAACMALALWGCGKAGEPATEPAEEVLAVETFPDGDPNDATCKGSYTDEDPVEIDRDAVAATIGDAVLTNGELQVWYWAEVAQYRLEGHEAAPDFDLPLDTQACEIDSSVSSWQQYFLKRALNTWHSSQALVFQGEDEGLPTEEAYQPDLEKHELYLTGMPATKYLYGYSESYQPNTMHQAYLDSIPELLETLAEEKGYAGAADMAEKAFGATEEALAAFMETYNRGYMYFTNLGYYIEPTEGEIDAYYGEHREEFTESGNYVTLRQILLVPEEIVKNGEVVAAVEVSPEGKVVCSEEAWEACEAEANALLKKWKTKTKATEATFGELANKNSDDAGMAPSGGAYKQIRKGQLIAELDEWCFDEERQIGDTAVIRSDYGYHILYFSGSTPIAYAQAEEDYQREQEAALIAAAREKYPMEVDYSAIGLACAEGTVALENVLYPDVAHERYPEIPLYLQQDYPYTEYGAFKITTNGCGITSFAMVASYMTDEEWTPPELCALYGNYSHSNGTDGMIFLNESPVLGFYVKEKSHDVFAVREALDEGYTVVSIQHPGYWTRGGHYIVLERVTEDGLIQVRDSNLYNYGKLEAHKEDKHTWGNIRQNGSGYWIFEKKVTRIGACSRCGEAEGVTDSLLRQDYLCEKCRPALLRRETYLSACGD